MEPRRPAVGSGCPNTQDVYWAPLPAWTTVPCGDRCRRVFARASTTSSERTWSAIDQPTTVATERVTDRSAVNPPARGPTLRDVGEPDSLRVFGGEPTLDQVVVSGGVWAIPALAEVTDPVDPGSAHEPGHAFAADAHAEAIRSWRGPGARDRCRRNRHGPPQSSL